MFTARYGLNPNITQIRFVFKRLNTSWSLKNLHLGRESKIPTFWCIYQTSLLFQYTVATYHRDHLQYQDVEIILKSQKEVGWEGATKLIGMEPGERGNEPSDSIECAEFLD